MWFLTVYFWEAVLQYLISFMFVSPQNRRCEPNIRQSEMLLQAQLGGNDAPTPLCIWHLLNYTSLAGRE